MVIALGLYITILPWLPGIKLWITQLLDDTNGYVYRGDLASGQVDSSKLSDPPEENTLLVPSIALDVPVVEGADISVLGVGGSWRRPKTSTPDKGGNTVIIGHRFSYSSEAAFYNLDKIDVGERFAIWWNRQEYIYEVFDKSVVPASAIEIEADTADPIATLYTCTPIWTATNRLVIKGHLVNTDILEPKP